MGSVLLHPCRPSVKMLCCCDGAAGANGRRMGAGCDDGAGCSGGKAAGGSCCGVGDGCVPGVIPDAVGCAGVLWRLQDGGIDYSRPWPELGLCGALLAG